MYFMFGSLSAAGVLLIVALVFAQAAEQAKPPKPPCTEQDLTMARTHAQYVMQNRDVLEERLASLSVELTAERQKRQALEKLLAEAKPKAKE